MLKPHKLCKVCQEIERNPKLEKEIYNTTYYLKSATMTLRRFVSLESHPFNYENLLNHVHKHQFMNNTDFKNRSLRGIKQTHKELTTEGTMVVKATEVWDGVMQKGMEELQEGNMSIKASDLLMAAKGKSDYELKVKDQEMQFMEMMWFFASGENKESRSYDRRIIEGKEAEDFNPALESSEDSGRGTDRPSGVYYPPSWDAATSGSN